MIHTTGERSLLLLLLFLIIAIIISLCATSDRGLIPKLAPREGERLGPFEAALVPVHATRAVGTRSMLITRKTEEENDRQYIAREGKNSNIHKPNQ